MLSHVSDHATVTKVQKDDGCDSQRKNISLGGNSFMLVGDSLLGRSHVSVQTSNRVVDSKSRERIQF